MATDGKEKSLMKIARLMGMSDKEALDEVTRLSREAKREAEYEKRKKEREAQIASKQSELDKWTEHAKEVLDFWPIAYYPFQMIKTESGAGLEDLCPEEEIKKDWEIVRGKDRPKTKLDKEDQ